MIKLTIAALNRSRATAIVPETETPRQTLENQGVDYSMGAVTLDGSPLMAGELDRPYGEFGLRDHAYLMVSYKPENA